MFRALRNLLLYRFLGGRVMLALALLGFVRRLLGRRRVSGSPPGPPSPKARSTTV